MMPKSEDYLSCPICHDIFRDPVLLSCSHSLCDECVKAWWRKKPTRECPVCKTRCVNDNPTRNLALKNLCEDYNQQKDIRSSKGVSKKLSLFCVEHKLPVCVLPSVQEQHLTDHRFKPVEEAVQKPKRELQETLELLKDRLKYFEETKAKFIEPARHIKFQAQLTEAKIKAQFEKLRTFLLEEEAFRLSALREEEEKKSLMIQEKVDALGRDIACLTDMVRDTEDELKAADVSLLLTHKTLKKRVEQRLQLEDPKLHEGALIDEAKHVGNLTFNIWNKIKDMAAYNPVVLDPNTAHPLLVPSDDLTFVKRGKKRPLPDNAERFNEYTSVLGSEGFNSGVHSWDIQVGHNAEWGVGVVEESQTKGTVCGLWRIGFHRGQYTAESPTTISSLAVKRKSKRIRVELDCNGGHLSFSDADHHGHIHTFTHTFTQKMFPYFSTKGALRLLPTNWETMDRLSLA